MDGNTRVSLLWIARSSDARLHLRKFRDRWRLLWLFALWHLRRFQFLPSGNHRFIISSYVIRITQGRDHRVASNQIFIHFGNAPINNWVLISYLMYRRLLIPWYHTTHPEDQSRPCFISFKTIIPVGSFKKPTLELWNSNNLSIDFSFNDII